MAVVDRLSKHLNKGIPAPAAASYLQQVKKMVPAEPVIHIDDSDVVKPDLLNYVKEILPSSGLRRERNLRGMLFMTS